MPPEPVEIDLTPDPHAYDKLMAAARADRLARFDDIMATETLAQAQRNIAHAAACRTAEANAQAHNRFAEADEALTKAKREADKAREDRQQMELEGKTV